ncbi:hypothetical protein BDV96DRAFT_605839 [Lophiotrema nucula]|uniref:Uncharacterized protein n=1 Tax=Lophiotrema nucula TaxID=690887 RepID=A0A6A5YM29_9PLEO|nr:hypothetical protein BDV96DRAFT_605839 [Lophiotrema nucula]
MQSTQLTNDEQEEACVQLCLELNFTQESIQAFYEPDVAIEEQHDVPSAYPIRVQIGTQGQHLVFAYLCEVSKKSATGEIKLRVWNESTDTLIRQFRVEDYKRFQRQKPFSAATHPERFRALVKFWFILAFRLGYTKTKNAPQIQFNTTFKREIAKARQEVVKQWKDGGGVLPSASTDGNDDSPSEETQREVADGEGTSEADIE